jgi:hypothetical protein
VMRGEHQLLTASGGGARKQCEKMLLSCCCVMCRSIAEYVAMLRMIAAPERKVGAVAIETTVRRRTHQVRPFGADVRGAL